MKIDGTIDHGWLLLFECSVSAERYSVCGAQATTSVAASRFISSLVASIRPSRRGLLDRQIERRPGGRPGRAGAAIGAERDLTGERRARRERHVVAEHRAGVIARRPQRKSRARKRGRV